MKIEDNLISNMENIKDLIHKLELKLLDPKVRGSVEELDQLLTDDFVEYGSSGLVYTKEMILDRLPSGSISTYELYDFEIVVFSDSVVQARYKTDRTNPDGSKLKSLRSSIWKNIDGKWQMSFHQSTPTS